MKKLFFAAFLGIMFTGCKKDFFDINTNPNSPTESSIEPNLILPQALHETGRIMTQNYSGLCHWMGWWARGGDYGPNVETESYNITYTFSQGNWTAWYNNLNDYNTIAKKANETGQKFYEAIARIMKTVGFMYLVDSYDNVPYSQAFNLSGAITPAYDLGRDIYKNLLKELDESLLLLNAVEPGKDTKISTSDIMFAGTVKSWKTFLNTQRLRLVLRLSKTSEIDHIAELKKVTADGYLVTMKSASVNPGYVVAKDKQNPFWNAYKLSEVGVVIDKFNRANNYALKQLMSKNDIRYQYYFEPASKPVSGNNYYGYNFGQNLPNDDPYKSDNSSAVAGKGLAKSATQGQWIITSIESMFLQAEAMARGFIPGDGKAKFIEAIKESFIWLGVTNAETEAQNYIDSGNEFVNWDASTNRVELIITQKYFSTVGISPFEAYCDYRRVGVPHVPLTMAANPKANIPVRYRYPQTEYDYNSQVVKSQNDPNPITQKVFWAK